MKVTNVVATVVLGAASLWGPAWAQNSTIPEDMGGPIVEGMCGGCHSLSGDVEGKEGPPLKGVVGRKAGTVPEFAYSDALQKLDVVWTPENLKAFLTNPSAFAPGTRKLIAVKNEARLDEVIAYLSTTQSAK